MSEWQPIETCPHHRVVQLWCPEGSVKGWVACSWRGQRSKEGFSIAAPGLMDGDEQRRIFVRLDEAPTHWREDDRTAPNEQ